jgi:cell division protein FtsX
MKKHFSVPHLTTKTTDADRKKLQHALQGVAGVDKVTLMPDSHQFEIVGKGSQEPKWDNISAASMKAGFQIESSKGSVKK